MMYQLFSASQASSFRYLCAPTQLFQAAAEELAAAIAAAKEEKRVAGFLQLRLGFGKSSAANKAKRPSMQVPFFGARY